MPRLQTRSIPGTPLGHPTRRRPRASQNVANQRALDEGCREAHFTALKDYQLATYLLSYSTVVDVMLVGNFDHAYLESVAGKLEGHMLDYHDLYAKCIDSIKDDAHKSLEARLTRGVGKAGGRLGKLIEASPIGDKVQVDEFLIDKSGKIKDFSQRRTEESAHALVVAKPQFTSPFIDCIRDLDRLHNKPVALLVSDDESVIVLPLAAG